MNLSSYLIRIDDVHESMNWINMNMLIAIFRKYRVNALLGVIPKCEDKKLIFAEKKKDFYDFLRLCIRSGDIVAQHGYTHVYDSSCSGMLEINNKSEFAGHPYRVQYNRIKLGKKILEDQNLWNGIFMPPAHSYDQVTLDVLNDLDFKAITDGYGFYPLYYSNILHIPQLFSRFIKVIPGIQQNCIHPNIINKFEIKKLERFIDQNNLKFTTYQELIMNSEKYKSSSKISWILTALLVKLVRKYRR
tara:strand:+ start:107 stop:844 length:738 start_codon:yes stop_codon:yes gene_type:complete